MEVIINVAIFWWDFETVPNIMCIGEFLQDSRKNTEILSEFSAKDVNFDIACTKFSAKDEFPVNARDIWSSFVDTNEMLLM